MSRICVLPDPYECHEKTLSHEVGLLLCTTIRLRAVLFWKMLPLQYHLLWDISVASEERGTEG